MKSLNDRSSKQNGGLIYRRHGIIERSNKGVMHERAS
jgi:hypothetical protein